jgi:hypothetical protein
MLKQHSELFVSGFNPGGVPIREETAKLFLQI